jgi:CRP-like cAMP-binding protein
VLRCRRKGVFVFNFVGPRGVGVTAALDGHRFAAGIPPHVRAELASLATRHEYRPGTVIFREGADADDLFLIDSGLVALDLYVAGRGPVRILTIGPGEMLGWSALLGRKSMTATATAQEQTTAFLIAGAKLRSLCDQNFEAGFRIMEQALTALAQRLTATRIQLLDLFAEPSRNTPDDLV